MKRNKSIVAVFALAALLGLALFGAAQLRAPVSPRAYHQCQDDAKKYGTQKPEDCPTSETVWQKTLADPVAYYTALLTLFTLALAGIGIAQSVLSGQQITLARDEFAAAHPPELVMRDVRWASADGLTSDIAFTLVNRGGVAATIEESIFRARSSLNRTETVEPEGVNELPITLAPGEFRPITTAMLTEGEQVLAAAVKMQIMEDHYWRGAIIYSSPGGLRRRMVFTRMCERSQLHFASVNDPELDYTD